MHGGLYGIIFHAIIMPQTLIDCQVLDGGNSPELNGSESGEIMAGLLGTDQLAVGDGPMNHSSKKRGRILAPIREDELYSLQTLRALTGWGDSAMRAARKSGLPPIHVHGRVFYRGADVVEYINKAEQMSNGEDGTLGNPSTGRPPETGLE